MVGYHVWRFLQFRDRVQLGGIKGDVMDIGVLEGNHHGGQWVDGDLYNGRIVLIANSFRFKEPVFNYSVIPFYGTKSKFNPVWK
jgi:small-conductance mechanosensitive channel